MRAALIKGAAVNTVDTVYVSTFARNQKWGRSYTFKVFAKCAFGNFSLRRQRNAYFLTL